MREVIDAEFVEVETPYRPFRFPWFSAFWFCVYVGAFAYLAATTDDPAMRAAYVIFAAFVGYAGRLLSLVGEKVTEQQAQQLRRRLLER